MYLGIDLGTSELKALLLDDQHQVVATAGVPLTVHRPQPLWSEQSPTEWWAALDHIMNKLLSEHSMAMARVRGIGLSGQMHGAVLLDDKHRVLRPAILWNDGRSADQCVELTGAVPDFERISGNLAMPGFTAPKILWVRQHEPDLFRQVRSVLLPKDWLRFELTGQAVSDMSDASGTLWLDVGRRDWSDTLLSATGLGREHMPRLVEGSEVSAALKPEWSKRWGLPLDVPLAGGGGDNASSAVGMGVVHPGQGFVSLGTSGVVFVCGKRFAPNPAQAVHAFCHALPGMWHQMSVMLSAASAVTWATRILGYSNEAALLDDASRMSESRQDRSPLFLPYLNGERSPHNNPYAQGAWVGMTMGHERSDLAYAVAEGVGFGLLDGLLTLNHGSTALESLSLVGGGARSPWWAQWLSNILNLRLDVHHGGEVGGALGAARLAWLAAGGQLDSVCHSPVVARSYLPNVSTHRRLSVRHGRFRALYPAIHSCL